MTAIVHRNQRIFRKTLDALSYPGKIVALSAERDYRGNLSNAIMELAMSLLDGEVSLYISNEDAVVFEEIAIRTNTVKGSLDEADFVIVPREDLSKLAEIILKVKRGGYVDPDKSATIIVEISEADEEDRYIFEGPGIKETKEVRLLKKDLWLDARNQAVEKFPMGVDIFFVSDDQTLLALPRTISVKVAGE